MGTDGKSINLTTGSYWKKVRWFKMSPKFLLYEHLKREKIAIVRHIYRFVATLEIAIGLASLLLKTDSENSNILSKRKNS